MKRSSLSVLFLDITILSLTCLITGLWGGTVKNHPDTVLWTSLRMFLENGWNPQFFNYPGLVLYLNAIVYALIFQLLNLFGQNLTSLSETSLLLKTPIQVSLLFPSHLIIVTFSVLGVICTYLLTCQITYSRRTGLIAGFLVATSFIWVSQSHYLTVDIPLAALCVATVCLTFWLTQNREPLNLPEILILGVALGLTTSAKYNGVLIYGAILVSLIPCYSFAYQNLLKIAGLILFIGFLTFSLTNPFIFTSGSSFIEAIQFELNHSQTGHLGYETDNGWLFHLTNSFYWGYGLVPLFLAGIGVCRLVGDRQIFVHDKITLLVFPTVYYLLVGSSSLAFQRYMLPTIPFLAILSAMGVNYITQKIAIKFISTKNPLILLVVFIPFIINTINGVEFNSLLPIIDTRLELSNIIKNADVSRTGLNIYTGGYTRKEVLHSPLKINKYITNKSQKSEYFQTVFDQIRENPNLIDIMVFDSFSHDRLLYSPGIQIKSPFTQDQKFYIIKLTPFKTEKLQVPFSPESIYAPSLPDLPFRNQPGPFIEIYIKQADLAQKLFKSCTQLRINCIWIPPYKGYYQSQLKN